MFDFYNKVLDRFIKYVKINTQSVPNSKDTPSSKCQFDLAKILYQECLDLGLSDVYYDDVGIIDGLLRLHFPDLYATLVEYRKYKEEGCGKLWTYRKLWP